MRFGRRAALRFLQPAGEEIALADETLALIGQCLDLPALLGREFRGLGGGLIALLSRRGPLRFKRGDPCPLGIRQFGDPLPRLVALACDHRALLVQRGDLFLQILAARRETRCRLVRFAARGLPLGVERFRVLRPIVRGLAQSRIRFVPLMAHRRDLRA